MLSNLRDINADIRATYADALRAQGAVDADEAMVAELRGLIERAKQRRPAAVPFFEVGLATIEQMLSMSRSGALIAQAGLRNQLRLPEDTVLRLTSSLNPVVPSVDVTTLLEAALAKRADVRDAQLRLQQAELSLFQSPWQQPGPVVLQNVARWVGDAERQRALGLLGRGCLDRSQRMALLSLEEARDDMNEQRARISSELRLLTINLAQAQRRLASLPSAKFALESLRQAEESVLSHADWRGRMAQVSNARNTWRLTYTASIDALSDYYSAFYRLKRSLGGM